jgi:2-polyprenyl-3-methyl-5-hydroxy-6-metoxy-1,4-benzoquinol methylase
VSATCRICGAGSGTPVATVTARHGTSTWVACEGCGVHRIAPYPGDAELAAYYASGYRESDEYASAGFSVSRLRRYAPEYRDTVHREYTMSMADLGVPADALDPAARVLDYGCADGMFLDFLAATGHPPERLEGLDISDEMLRDAAAKGYRTHPGAAFDPQRDGPFDLISLWDVLEHVPSPRETLGVLRDALVPDTGRVLIQTPRIGLLAGALGDRFEHYLPLEHLHLFPRERLTALAREEGLRVVAARSFGANAPARHVPKPYKNAYDALAKATDQGATQLVLLARA